MPGSIQSIERAAAVLQVLASSSGPVTLADLAGTLGLAKPTVHGIVRTLCQVGFVEQRPDSGRYTLGQGLSGLGRTLDPHLLRSRAVNWADGLVAKSGLEVQLGIRSNGAVEILHHVFRPDGSPQRLRVGEQQPLHATALGQVLLAFAPLEESRHGLELTAYTPTTITQHDELGRALRAVRRQGWASVDGGLYLGVAGVAAPIKQYGDVGVGALGVVGPRERVLNALGRPLEPLLTQVLDCCRSISEHLEERL